MRLIFTLMHFSFHFLISRHKSTHHCPVLLLLQVAKLLLWYSPWCYIYNPLTRHAHCSGSEACEPPTRRDQNSWARSDPQTSLKDPPPVFLHQNHNQNDIIGSQSQPKPQKAIRMTVKTAGIPHGPPGGDQRVRDARLRDRLWSACPRISGFH